MELAKTLGFMLQVKELFTIRLILESIRQV